VIRNEPLCSVFQIPFIALKQIGVFGGFFVLLSTTRRTQKGTQETEHDIFLFFLSEFTVHSYLFPEVDVTQSVRFERSA
jgi:hypothetical protein